MTEQNEPWWHRAPDEPPVDSVLVEGMKLAAALRDWAVDSGAAAAVVEVATSAATSAASYVSQLSAAHVEEVEEPVTVVRCSDCPVCRGLDALDRSNPQMAQTVRAALAQVNGLLEGLLPDVEQDGS